MIGVLETLYRRAVLGHPATCLLLTALLVVLAGSGLPDLRIEASSDSLLLESDRDYDLYRSVRARYGSDDFLVVTYRPRDDLFSDQTLGELQGLRDALAQVEGVADVTSILDVPLFESPPATPKEIADGSTRLLDERTDIELAQEEFRSNPLYADRLLSADGQTTALQVDLERNQALASRLDERARLRVKQADSGLDADERTRLTQLSRDIRPLREARQTAIAAVVADTRAVLDDYRDGAEVQLSGLPMINSDIIGFIDHDLRVFGSVLLVVVVVMLGIIFRDWRWVVLPLIVCGATILTMLGLLGHLDWPITVVSSNFVSLLLILTLSLNIHLAVRYRELQALQPEATQMALVAETAQTKFMPALLTAVSTMVAFGSLVVSEIRPVIDFGLMMVAGLGVAFVLTLVILPPLLILIGKGPAPVRARISDRFTGALGRLVTGRPRAIGAVFVLAAVASAWGMSALSLQNRFIDYFDESTEITKGMTVIDKQLGGTTPLEVLLDAPEGFGEDDTGATDMTALPGEPGLAATSYWFNPRRLREVEAAHDFLLGREAVGSVVSLHSTIYVIDALAGSDDLDTFAMSVIAEGLPGPVSDTLIDPYLAEDGNQMRLAARVHETLPSLDREALLEEIRAYYVEDMGLGEDRVHITGLFVLYNNVLQSLLRSQLTTVGAVFVAVLAMFVIAFRSPGVAAIAIVPNVLAAAIVLGIMGSAGLSLDIMTIAIAAVAIGIGVDDTIHYVHRFEDEYRRSGVFRTAMENSQHGVGRAMFFTSLVIIAGFAVLVFSEFLPTVYFGALTGLAMAIALLANLTLLPVLLAYIRTGKHGSRTDD